MAIFGSKTFVPISWFCKKQTAVSHSSTEAEVLSMDTAVRMEGLPALALMESIVEVFGPKLTDQQRTQLIQASPSPTASLRTTPMRGTRVFETPEEAISDLRVDETIHSVPIALGRAKLYIFEDNEAVIKMVAKGRSPTLQYMCRTQRIDIDWLWERLRNEPGVCLRYVNTLRQIADMFTKGLFSKAQWFALLELARIGPNKNIIKGLSSTDKTHVTDTSLSLVVPTPIAKGGEVAILQPVTPKKKHPKINWEDPAFGTPDKK